MQSRQGLVTSGPGSLEGGGRAGPPFLRLDGAQGGSPTPTPTLQGCGRRRPSLPPPRPFISLASRAFRPLKGGDSSASPPGLSAAPSPVARRAALSTSGRVCQARAGKPRLQGATPRLQPGPPSRETPLLKGGACGAGLLDSPAPPSCSCWGFTAFWALPMCGSPTRSPLKTPASSAPQCTSRAPLLFRGEGEPGVQSPFPKTAKLWTEGRGWGREALGLPG